MGSTPPYFLSGDNICRIRSLDSRETIMKNHQLARQGGFTLIELMIVIAIVGILAAIALPAYQDYTVRAEVSEGLAFAAEAKTSIAEYYATQGVMPTAAQAGLTTNPNTDVVASIKYADGSGLIGVGLQAGVVPGTALNVGFTLSAITRTGSRSIIWSCGTTATGLAADAGGLTGNVEAKYLPSSCRG
jgi:type IV pilus assembly protein PilA